MQVFSTYDITFDETFRGIAIVVNAPTAPECQQPGVYLTWLSPRGWCYWLFSGKADTDAKVTSLGQVRRAGLTTSTQKERADVVTCRAGNLTRARIDKISTILDSVAVYVILRGPDGAEMAVRVDIDAGSYPIWRDSIKRGTAEFKITLPARRSQLA